MKNPKDTDPAKAKSAKKTSAKTTKESRATQPKRGEASDEATALGVSEPQAKKPPLLDVSSLLDETIADDDAITELMLQCAAILAFRRSQATGADGLSSIMRRSPARSLRQSGLCYRSTSGESLVQIYAGHLPAGKMTREQAESQDIRPCG